MTQNVIREQPIIGLDVTKMVTQEQSNVTGVREGSIEPSFAFIRELIPHLKKVTMVYSASDKNYEMVQAFQKVAAFDDVVIQPIMIQSLADLYVLAQTVDQDTDAIFIAKDHLVASGAPTLAQAAIKFQIPLITSDNGSVIAGAAVAIGNKESDIGRRGAEIAIQLLEGANPKDIPMQPLSSYTVFVNGHAIHKQDLTLEKIQIAARILGYPLEMVQ
jgi:putative ABC transport system substrate-binding protein